MPSRYTFSVLVGGDEFWLTMIAALAVLAIVAFLRIQSYLDDPRRQQFNEEWFARFEENMRRRYRDKGLLWRIHVLDGQFCDRRPPQRR